MHARRWVIGSLGLLLLVPLACGSSPSSSSSSSGGPGAGAKANVDIQPVVMNRQVKAASAAYAAQLDVLQVASKGGTIDLTKALPPLEVSGPQADALARAVHTQATWLAAATALGGISTSAIGSLSLKTRSGESIGIVRSAIIGIDDAIIIAGIAIVAWGASKGVQKAVEIRTDPTAQKIDSASAGDLKVINDALGLPASTTKADAKKAFDDLGMGARLAKAKSIEQDLRVAETTNTPGVNSIPAEQINRAVAESSVECGKTALKTTVSASTFSGQGFAQAAQALGASERAASVIDLTISAVGEATNTPLQPLDRFASHLEGTLASKQTTNVVIPAVPAGMTSDSATKILAADDPKLSDFAAAIDAKIRGVVDSLSSLIGAIAKGDGTVAVDAPDQVHQVIVDDAKNVQVVEFPAVGPATLLVSTDCHGSEVFTVDTTAATSVSYSITQNTCQSDCSADLQLVDVEVTLPAECEKCINSMCGAKCAACDPTCLQKGEACYDHCADIHRACDQDCASCSGEDCFSACVGPCTTANYTCENACDALPESTAASAIGECVQGPCGTACASVIK